MEHLDEGLAHAWIDGELSTDDAAFVESHVQTCDQCAAMIAEARGLVAASSRIVSQLDHVAAGVLPAGSVTRPALARARRVWWRHPAFAAAAVLTVTTMSWLSVRRAPGVTTVAVAPAQVVDMPATVAAPAVTNPEAANHTATTGASAIQRAESAQSARTRVADASGAGEPPAQRSQPRALEDRPSSAADRAAASEVAPQQSGVSVTPPRGLMDSAEARRPEGGMTAPSSAGNAQRAAIAKIGTPELAVAAPSPVASPAPSAALARQTAKASSSEAERRSDMTVNRASLSGCYLLAPAAGSARATTMQIPLRLRLTDSVRTPSSATATFLAYGLRDGGATELPLVYRRVGLSALELAPLIGSTVFEDGTFVRVVVLPIGGERSGPTPSDAEFVARPRSCP